MPSGPAPGPPAPATWRVLVIDDDRMFTEIVRVTLERSGCFVDAETDPRAGLDRAIEGDYDLVLLDLMMPGMTGEEVLGLLKPLSLGQRVVIVSASDEADARARTRDLGAAGYIRKPVDARDLVRILGEILKERARRAGAGPPSPAGADRLTAFVFGGGPFTKERRLAAAGILAFLLAVLSALILI